LTNRYITYLVMTVVSCMLIMLGLSLLWKRKSEHVKVMAVEPHSKSTITSSLDTKETRISGNIIKPLATSPTICRARRDASEGQKRRRTFVLCTGKAKLSTTSHEGKTIITKLVLREPAPEAIFSLALLSSSGRFEWH
jgi:hypothetical protein